MQLSEFDNIVILLAWPTHNPAFLEREGEGGAHYLVYIPMAHNKMGTHLNDNLLQTPHSPF